MRGVPGVGDEVETAVGQQLCHLFVYGYKLGIQLASDEQRGQG